jgi:hypothetical protein
LVPLLKEQVAFLKGQLHASEEREKHYRSLWEEEKAKSSRTSSSNIQNSGTTNPTISADAVCSNIVDYFCKWIFCASFLSKKKQTTNNKQQTTNNKQQTTNNKQQTTNNKQQ